LAYFRRTLFQKLQITVISPT